MAVFLLQSGVCRMEHHLKLSLPQSILILICCMFGGCHLGFYWLVSVLMQLTMNRFLLLLRWRFLGLVVLSQALPMLSQRLKSDWRFQLLLDSTDCFVKWLLQRSLPLIKLRRLSILLLVSTKKTLNLLIQMMLRWWKKLSTGVGTSSGTRGRNCTRLVLWVHRLSFYSYLLLFLILSSPSVMAGFIHAREAESEWA